MAKRIILIHGRATKPRPLEKLRLVRQALIHGLGRADPECAQRVENGDVPFDLVYYGDINNAVLWASEQHPRKVITADFLSWPFPYEADGSYDQSMARLLAEKHQTEQRYKTLRRQERDLGLVDNLLAVVSPLANLTGLNDELINSFLPDLGAYFKYNLIGSMIRQRLQQVLIPALQQGDDICLIAHSMGSAVAYDVLWKLSRMSEHQTLHGRKLSLFVTLGSPLGEPVVAKQLYDANRPDDGRYPANLLDWHNFAAKDDFISHDDRLADDFAPMLQRKMLRRIRDHFIYNLWVGDDGLNPHKLYGYLDNLQVCRLLADWMNAP